MATKPTFSPPQFGLGDGSGNYTSGARTGDPSRIAIPDVTNGYTPGVVIEPESFNFYIGGSILDWQTNWLALGSALAGLDAHIVETASDGRVQIASANFGGTSYVDTPLGAAVFITNNTGAAATKGLLVTTDDGTAIEAGNSSSSRPALYVSNDFSGGGLGLQVQALDGGKVAEFQAVTDPADGVDIDGLGAAKYGARIRASDIGAAILILERIGAGTPVRGAIEFDEHVRPTAPLAGDIWKTPGATGFGRGNLEWEDLGGGPASIKGTQRAWSSTGGLGYASNESTGDTTENWAAFTTKVSVTLDAGGTSGTAPDGDYWVEWSALVHPFDVAVPNILVNFAGPGGFTETVTMVAAQNGFIVPVTFRKRFAFTGGPDTWTLKFRTETAGQDVVMNEASIVVRGAYE
jgi:hypothetical protein